MEVTYLEFLSFMTAGQSVAELYILAFTITKPVHHLGELGTDKNILFSQYEPHCVWRSIYHPLWEHMTKTSKGNDNLYIA